MFSPGRQRLAAETVNLDDMDPETMARFYAAQDHPLIRWLLVIVSAARTYAHQLRLYLGYKQGRPGYNLAANPDWERPDGTKGSRHMVQLITGYAYALDLRLTGGLLWPLVHRILKGYGLRFPVYRPKRENWHCQALEKFVDGKPVYYPVKPKREAEVEAWRQRIMASGSADGSSWTAVGVASQDTGLAEVARFVADCRKLTLRRGDKGPPVKFLQQCLNRHNAPIPGTAQAWEALALDSRFGPATEGAVRMFQAHADNAMPIDGVVGKFTWSALLD